MACSAPAQVFVVDAHNGPGTAFVDLQAAVAAAPDGAVLDVRPGSYRPFSVASKSLTIVVADPTMTSLARGDVTIGPLPGDEIVRIVGLRHAMGSLEPNPRFVIHDCIGEVTLESCSDPWPSATASSGLLVVDSANVHVHGTKFGASLLPTTAAEPAATIRGSRVELAFCRFEGGSTLVFGGRGAPGLSIEQGSYVAAYGCEIEGGSGRSPITDPGPCGDGGPAVHCVSSLVELIGGGAFGLPHLPSVGVHGGRGGTSLVGQPGGDSGPAMVLEQGSFARRTHYLSLGAGTPGVGTPGGSSPPDLVLDASSGQEWLPYKQMSAKTVTPPQAGQTAEIRCWPPTSIGPQTVTFAVLALSLAATVTTSPVVELGLVGCDASLGTVGVAPIPTGTGVASPSTVSFAIPVTIPVGTALTTQFFGLYIGPNGPANGIVASNTVPVVVRGP